MCLHCAEEEKQLLMLSSLLSSVSDDGSPSLRETVVRKIRSNYRESYVVPFRKPILAGFITAVFFIAGVTGFIAYQENGAAYDELKDFDDFPPGSFSRIYMNTVKEK